MGEVASHAGGTGWGLVSKVEGQDTGGRKDKDGGS